MHIQFAVTRWQHHSTINHSRTCAQTYTHTRDKISDERAHVAHKHTHEIASLAVSKTSVNNDDNNNDSYNNDITAHSLLEGHFRATLMIILMVNQLLIIEPMSRPIGWWHQLHKMNLVLPYKCIAVKFYSWSYMKSSKWLLAFINIFLYIHYI